MLPSGQLSGLVSEPTRAIDRVVFSANKVSPMREVWGSDGTAAGTQPVTDFNAAAAGLSGLGNAPRGFAPIGRHVLFGAGDNSGATFQSRVFGLDLADQQVTPLLDSSLGATIRLADDLIFTAYDFPEDPIGIPMQGDITGAIYKSRGTPGTTELLFPLDFAFLPTGELAPVGDRFLMALNTAGFGQELWVSDGTKAGTQMLLEVVPGPGPSFPRELTGVGERVYFTTRSAQVSAQALLWVTDGTQAGTQLVFDNSAAPGVLTNVPITGLLRFGDRLVFAARDQTGELEPWITDGSPAGTQRLVDLGPSGVNLGFNTGVEEIVLTSEADRLWFARRLVISASSSLMELWSSDGSAAGTALVATFPEVEQKALTRFADLDFKDRIVFSAKDSGGIEPWVSDGTTQGTRRLLDLYPGPIGSMDTAGALVVSRLGSQLLFGARLPNIGIELAVVPISTAGGWAKAALGESCGGVLGRPAIDANGSAALGGTVRVEVGDLLPQTLVLMQFGAAPSLPLGAGQCALQLVSPQLLGFAVADGSGMAGIDLNVPMNPNLIDRTANFQALALDPSAGFLGLFSTSQVLEIALGG